MFALHESTRRRVIRTAFCVCCLLPTFGVAGWSAWRQWPAHSKAVLDRLGAALDCRVTAESVVELRPNQWQVESVRFLETAGDRPLLEVDTLRLERHAELWSVAVDRAVATEAGARWAWQQTRRGLLGQLDTGKKLRLTCTELVLEATPGKDVRLAELDGGIDSLAEKSHAFIMFRGAGSTGEPARLWAVRSIGPREEPIRLVLLSGDAPLACAAAAPFFPDVLALGWEATFQGYLAASLDEEPVFEVRPAEIRGIDLGRLVGGSLGPRAWRGVADLRMDRAWTRGGKLEVVEAGALSGPAGALSLPLAQSLAEQLRLAYSPPAAPGAVEIPYQQLYCRFTLRPGTLLLEGGGEGDFAGALLADNEGAIFRSNGETLPLAAFVRAFAGHSRELTPITPTAAALMARLPIIDDSIPHVAEGPGGAER